ncbi:serpin family protein [Rhodohalobacter sp. SW132]|uniref:serpin family protein n=1 Tax=Rhodohalobacter sp. SW132 TaxID=2293433 RepID=UPI000E22C2D2|nr:serpin family protein [Rhodohalobacter sp. SW132]REL33492.1 serpin family protein [Rhodohalobacter sp. SW132]
MLRFFYSLIALAGLLFFLSCDSDVTGPDSPGINGELPRDLTQSEQKLIQADNLFSYRVFRETLAYDDEDNIMISPLSISMALAMTLNGAEGETYDAMRETLHLSDMDLEEINEAFGSLIELLVTVDPRVTLQIANSVWHRENLQVKEDFRDRVETHFGAQIEGLDFSDPATVEKMNSWVNENTEGLIPEIIDEIPSHVVMYLINALYFKGDWLQQFDAEDTRPADFYLESGETTEVDMMSQKGRFAIFQSGEVQLVELPYGDSLFTMTVMMPADEDMPIDQFVQEQVNADNLAEWRSNLHVSNRESTVRLPKFEMEYEIEYNEILKAMGMEIAFSQSNANFQGIADTAPQNLYIDNVKHKTFITVDEEGTEAAAVTSVGVGVTSMPPQITFNRPFVFIIHERESGTNLFMGRVKNPGLE